MESTSSEVHAAASSLSLSLSLSVSLFRRSIPELVIEFVRRASEPTISPFNIASFGSRSFDLREYL